MSTPNLDRACDRVYSAALRAAKAGDVDTAVRLLSNLTPEARENMRGLHLGLATGGHGPKTRAALDVLSPLLN